MTPQRAAELLNVRSTVPGLGSMRVIDCGDIRDHMTAAEHDEVRAVWDRMPGYTCYADALRRIAHGTADPITCPSCGVEHNDDGTFCDNCTPEV